MIEQIENPQSIKQISRFVGQVIGEQKGPTHVFFGGIHGNEPAGVKALESLFDKLDRDAQQRSNKVMMKLIDLSVSFKRLYSRELLISLTKK